MAKRRYELDTRIFTVFIFVSMPFLAFGSFMVVSMARSLLQESVGQSLEQQAVETKLLLERYVGDQIVHLHLLSLDPQVRAAVAAPRPAGELAAADQAWAAGTDAKLTAAVLESPLAQRLREVERVRPAVKLLEVVDANGRVVAASSRAGHVDQSQAVWFNAVPRYKTDARAFVSDIQRSNARALPFLEVAYPVYDPANGNWQGAVRAVVDASDLFGVLAPVRVGRTGHAELVRTSDGMTLATDDTSRILADAYAGFPTLETALAERRGWRVMPAVMGKGQDGAEVVRAPARVVGVSAIEQVPNVQWLVVVQQDLAEAMAPVSGVTRYLWIHFVGAFATVIVLAFYFSFKLERPVIEEELHLHEEHVPSGARPIAS